jgi:ketosteroid isomerase-like protein
MTNRTAVARRLYEVINARDPGAILAGTTEDFVGEVSVGMPLGVGGRHAGNEAMLREVWAPVLAAYDVRLEVERYLETDDGTVVVIGNYRGVERASGRSLDARFAHFLAIRGDRVSSLEQVTDTRRWTDLR